MADDNTTSTSPFSITGNQMSAASFGMNLASQVMGAYSSFVNYTAQAAIAKNNIAIVDENIRGTRAERAINMAFTRTSAKHATDSGVASMAASGNIGTSADAVTYDGLNALDSDLSTMRFNYDARITELQNQKNQYEYEKKMARRNRTSALIGAGLTVAGAAAGFMLGGPAGAAAGSAAGSAAKS